ncbi:MAG: ATP-binding protein [Hyphomicrobiaceae bacterium]
MRVLARTADASLAMVGVLRKALRAALVELPIEPAMVNDMQLIFAELATNAIRHGRPAPGTLGLEVDLAGMWLRLAVIDDGGPFAEFRDRCAAVRTRDIAAHGESGLGLLLAQDLSHRLVYNCGPPNRLDVWRPFTGRRPTVLMLDADAGRLALRAAALRPQLQVLAATSAELAAALLRQSPVDLVLCTRDLGAAIAGDLAAVGADQPVIEMAGEGIDALVAEVRRKVAERVRRMAMTDRRRMASVDARMLGSGMLCPGFEVVVATTAKAEPPCGIALVAHAVRGAHRLVLVENLRFDGHVAVELAAIANRIEELAGIASCGPAAFLMQLSAMLAIEAGIGHTIPAVTAVEVAPSGLASIAAGTGRAVGLCSRGNTSSIATDGPAVGLSVAHHYADARIALARGEALILASEAVYDGPPAGDGTLLPVWLTDTVRGFVDAASEELQGRLEIALQLRLADAPRDAAVVVVRPAVSPALA